MAIRMSKEIWSPKGLSILYVYTYIYMHIYTYIYIQTLYRLRTIVMAIRMSKEIRSLYIDLYVYIYICIDYRYRYIDIYTYYIYIYTHCVYIYSYAYIRTIVMAIRMSKEIWSPKGLSAGWNKKLATMQARRPTAARPWRRGGGGAFRKRLSPGDFPRHLEILGPDNKKTVS